MTKIFVVRHGQDEDNADGLLNGRRDRPLTELGRQQVNVTAQKLRGHGIVAIYSSPSKRAAGTARIISPQICVPVIFLNSLLLERDFGILTGKPLTDIPKYGSKLIQIGETTYFLEAEGAENFPVVFERAKKFVREVVAEHQNQNILVATHGDTGKMIRAVCSGWSWEEGLKTPFIGNAEVLELEVDGCLIKKEESENEGDD